MEEKKVKKIDFDLEEIKKLSEEADLNKGLQLGFEQEFENEIMSFDVIDDIQNPEKAYKVYYAIEGILRTHLPSNEKYKELRRFIREEKIIFLTGGKKKNEAGIRGADSRQAYISTHLEVVLKNLLEWIQEGTSTFELFLKLRRLNIDYGYFKEEEISEYDQKLFQQKNIDEKKI